MFVTVQQRFLEKGSIPKAHSRSKSASPTYYLAYLLICAFQGCPAPKVY
jgi:hypothetical protein